MLVDASTSMDTPDVAAGPTRFAAAAALARELAPDAPDQFEVRTVVFAGSTNAGRSGRIAACPARRTRRPTWPGAIAAGLVEDRPQGQSIVLL